MEKVWLKSYPPGVPVEVDLDAYTSVTDVFEQAVEKFGARPCFSNMGTTLTYDDMDRYTAQLAAYLQSLPGMSKGDRVAVMMPNVLQNPIAIFAVLRAGFTVVNTNPLYTPRELKHQLVDSGARVIIVMENFCHTLADVIDETPVEHVITTQLGDLLKFPKSVIVNLVVNALQAMTEGGTLTVETGRLGENLVLVVEDTGAGMDEDALRNIFVPFYTTKDIHEGTGLGLPVVHGIVTSHGGIVGVESKVGRGTRFEIEFPVDGPSTDRSA